MVRESFGTKPKSAEEDIQSLLRRSALYSTGLIDNEFLSVPLSAGTSAFLQRFLRAESGLRSKPDSFLVDEMVLTKSDFIYHITEYPQGIDTSLLASLLMPSKKMKDNLAFLIKENVLNAPRVWSKFLLWNKASKNYTFFNRALSEEEFDWKHLMQSGILRMDKIDEPDDGFDAVEVQALQNDLLGYSRKSEVYPLDKKAHPLVQRMRGQENTKKMSAQIERVLGPEGQGTVLEDFTRVFEFYLPKASLFRELRAREKIAERKREDARKRHIKLVNDHQLREYQKKYPGRATPEFDPTKRHFDIYARYGHGQMDPLQLAFISKTAEWYIMGGRSQLFNSVRIVPYRTDSDYLKPYVAQAVCEGSEMLDVSGTDFKMSMMGANRTFLTHSASQEATHVGSIPIIGLATHQNPDKRSENPDEFVVFNALFDPKDRWNAFHGKKSGESAGVNGDIAGLINETLRTLIEVEDKEIARAERALEEMQQEDEQETEEELPKAA